MVTLTTTRPRIPMHQAYAHLKMVQLAFWRRPGLAVVSVSLPLFFGIFLPWRIAGSGDVDHEHKAMMSVVGFMCFAFFFATYNLVQSMAARRDALIFKRELCTGVRPSAIFIGEMLGGVLPAVAVFAVLWIYGAIALHLGIPENPAAFVSAILLGALIFSALGVLIAGIVPVAELGMLVAAPLMLAFFYLSGLLVPIDDLPHAVAMWVRWLPLSLMVSVLRDAFGLESSVPAVPLALLAMIAWAGVLFVLALRFFRWNPRRR